MPRTGPFKEVRSSNIFPNRFIRLYVVKMKTLVSAITPLETLATRASHGRCENGGYQERIKLACGYIKKMSFLLETGRMPEGKGGPFPRKKSWGQVSSFPHQSPLENWKGAHASDISFTNVIAENRRGSGQINIYIYIEPDLWKPHQRGPGSHTP